MRRCYHCHETVPPGTDYTIVSDEETRWFCCPGCLAVAELIRDQGLARFYEFRTAPALKAAEPRATDRPWSVCDRPEVADRLLRTVGEKTAEIAFRVEGVNCAACIWLIDRGLRALDGVEDVSVNPITNETRVTFDRHRVRLSRILEAVADLGFVPHPAVGGSYAPANTASRDALKRLAVAGLGFAQVMTLSAALYLGAFKAMDTGFTSFFVIASMLIATPVVLYSGAPIFRAALNSIAHRRLGMDVPVSLAIVIAVAASLVNAFRGTGQVYFDSATMFVFFLTLGRFLEARARHRASGLVAALGEVRPLSALRRTADGDERVGTVELVPGDVVVIAPGEPLPADGELLSASATLDESLLSGESPGRLRERGEAVLGGSLNVGRSPIEMCVRQSGNDGYIDRVGDLLNRAMAQRPDFLRLADRWAALFVGAVLTLTIAIGSFWLMHDSARALEVVLAMLVVTCPCALSLAAPTAFAVALGRLARIGLLCRSARVIERIGQVNVWLFDKTGTLTEGRINIARIDQLGEVGETRCLDIAAALERGIEHPIAHAFRRIAGTGPADDVEFTPGRGLTGRVDGREYRLGSARHVGYAAEADEGTCIYLADASSVLARIVLADRIRPHTRAALDRLRTTAGLELVSGDSLPAVSACADTLGIETFAAELLPEDKLALLRDRQRGGAVVAAVGDGINDAPVLAQADVSIAMLSGSELAKATADVVFTGTDLRTLARLPSLAAQTRRIVRQNLAWAAAYNLIVIPLAATGILVPWMAALGMSASSLVVVGNALRLNNLLTEKPASERTDVAALPLGSASN